MPIETIDRQPVIFNEVIDSCNLGTRDLPNLVDNVDLTYFQFKITPCDNAPQLLANPTFTNPIPGWQVDGSGWTLGALVGGASYVGSTPNNVLYQDPILERGKFYEVIVEVTAIQTDGFLFIGTEEPVTGISFDFGDDSRISTTGTYTFYGFSQGEKFVIIPDATTTSVTINSVYVREVDVRIAMVFQDCDGVNLQQWRFDDYIEEQTFNITLPPPVGTTISYDKIVFDSDVFELNGNYITAAFNWQGEANGCYRLCLADPCINTNSQLYVYNGEFKLDNPSTQGWILENFGADSWQINNDALRFNLALQNPISFATATQDDVLGIGITYNYEINIASINNADVTITYGTQSVTYSTAGTHSGTITSDGVDLEIKVESTGIGLDDSSAAIDYIRHDAVLADIEPEYCSNKFDKCGQHDCTKLLHLCNQEDSFGFKFGGSFIPNVRVPARLVNPSYEYNDIIREDDSLGRRHIIYGENRRKRLLKIGAVPARIHDFLSLSLISDDFLINNQEYVVEEDEYEVQYSDRREDIGYIQLEVSEKNQLYRNVKCNASTAVCYLPPNHLLSGDGAFVISGGSGIAIQLGG
jgi:hypothetical protein